jgi:hypothetical protein
MVSHGHDPNRTMLGDPPESVWAQFLPDERERLRDGPMRRASRKIVVGHDVWIGSEAVILPGVRIGDGAVVAMRSVVTADVPAFAIVGGNPAHVLRYRFRADIVAALRRIAWWHWSDEKIAENLPLLLGDPAAFVRAHDAAAGSVAPALPATTNLDAELLHFITESCGSEAVGWTTPLLSDGLLSSFALMELLAWIEAHYAVRIDVATIDAGNFDTPEQILAVIASRRGLGR